MIFSVSVSVTTVENKQSDVRFYCDELTCVCTSYLCHLFVTSIMVCSALTCVTPRCHLVTDVPNIVVTTDPDGNPRSLPEVPTVPCVHNLVINSLVRIVVNTVLVTCRLQPLTLSANIS